VPRFVAVKHQTPLAAYDQALPASAFRGEDRLAADTFRQRGLRTSQVEEAKTFRLRQGLSANVATTPLVKITDVQALQAYHVDLGYGEMLATDKFVQLNEAVRARLARQVDLAIRLSRRQGAEAVQDKDVGLRIIGRADGMGVVSATAELREYVLCCEGARVALPEQPLQVCKWASAEGAQVGDTVTFFIRYNNLGGRPVRDIAITDSLSARLEYVPGTAKSDREAIFVTQENEAGSLLLRWEIKDPLPPGRRGVVSFQAKIK
jgi:uncharacterized repeat protein (TIGR01451 family)